LFLPKETQPLPPLTLSKSNCIQVLPPHAFNYFARNYYLVLILHIAVVGTGNVGRATAYTILYEGLPEELSLVDVKPGLAPAFAEELKHAAAGLRLDVEINAYERDEDLHGADLVVICAGHPRKPGERITRRELTKYNAEIIRFIAEVIPPNNPGAKYVVVTNPVDAMATLFKKVSRTEFVVSTGTHLETLRFRAKLAEALGIPVSKVDGYVGGEHGQAAVILWSTVTAYGVGIDEYVRRRNISLSKEGVEAYMKEVSEKIIDALGATRYGPAVAFRDIIKSIVLNLGMVLSIATPYRTEEIPEDVLVSRPTRVGLAIGPAYDNILTEEEKIKLNEAAKAIYSTYRKALDLISN